MATGLSSVSKVGTLVNLRVSEGRPLFFQGNNRGALFQGASPSNKPEGAPAVWSFGQAIGELSCICPERFHRVQSGYSLDRKQASPIGTS
jgi:hypothetical protein